jgi:adenylate cyclase
MGPQEPKIERRLAAIFAADVAGYSRLMGQDEVGTLQTVNGGQIPGQCDGVKAGH